MNDTGSNAQVSVQAKPAGGVMLTPHSTKKHSNDKATLSLQTYLPCRLSVLKCIRSRSVCPHSNNVLT